MPSILTTAPGVVRILLENIVLSRAKATADLEKDRGPHMKLFWAWFNLFCWILIAIALVKFAPICWDIYKGQPRTASSYYKKLMRYHGVSTLYEGHDGSVWFVRDNEKIYVKREM